MKLSISFFVLAFLCSSCQRRLAKMPETLAETSGLLCLSPRYILSHNDGGNKAELYIYDTDLRSWQSLALDSQVQNIDWEDMSRGPAGSFLLGDIGNNRNNRRNLLLYKLALPDSQNLQKELPLLAKYPFYYPEQSAYPPVLRRDYHYDAEALFYKEGFAYILTKNRTKPYTRWVYLYRIDLGKTNELQAAERIDSLRLRGRHWMSSAITGAAYSEERGELALISARRIYLFSDFVLPKLSQARKQKVYQLPLRQHEAIDFCGQKLLYSNESRRFLGRARLRYKKLP